MIAMPCPIPLWETDAPAGAEVAAAATLLAQGRTAEARALADAWLERAEAAGAGAAAACLWGSAARRAAGDLAAARQWALQALALAEPGAAARDRLLAHLELGLIAAALGDVQPARRHLAAFLGAAPGAGAPPHLRAAAYQALGHAAVAAREYAAAAAAWTDAAALEAAPGSQAGAGIAVAWAWLMARDARRAYPYIKAAEERLSGLPPALRAAHLVNRGLWQHLAGEPYGALATCAEVLREAEATDRDRAQAAWLAGEVCLEGGDRAGARAYGEQAMAHARRANWPALADRVQVLLARAEAG